MAKMALNVISGLTWENLVAVRIVDTDGLEGVRANA